MSNFVGMEIFNMVRTQVQLTERQAELIKKLAKQKGVSMAEIIRQGINAIFKEEKAIITEERQKRALSAVGKFHSGASDISEKHDEYLEDTYK